MPGKGQVGGSLGGAVQQTRARRRRDARRRRREVQRWAALAGPVTVSRVADPERQQARPQT